MNKLYAALVAAAIAVPGAIVLAAPASAEVYYKNCDAVRAAGKDPLYRGDPGYRPALDRDNDGIACEPRGGSKKRDDDNDDSKDDSGSNDKDSTSSRETTKSTSRSDSSSSRRSYSQVGEDDVPVGGVATGGG
jgi:hypothetical protein